MAPTFEEIGESAAVAAIRTVLNCFLGKEIEAEKPELDSGTALHVLLELLPAAGLLRLALEPTWRQIVVAAVIVVLRRVLSSALAWSDGARRRAAPRAGGGGQSVPHC